MNESRRNLIRYGSATLAAFALPRTAHSLPIDAFPAEDIGRGRYELGRSLSFSDPAPMPALTGEGLPPSGVRLADDGFLDGRGHTIYSEQGEASDSAIITLYHTAEGRLSESVVVENLRFGYARYGIITPFEADRPAANAPPADEWYKRGGHVIRNIQGHAYERCVRIAARDTLLEDFNVWGVGGTSRPASRAIAIDLLGPCPVVRNGLIRGIAQKPEAVGLSLSADCDGAIVNTVAIANPSLAQNTWGMWIGYSDTIHVRKLRIKNMWHAIGVVASEGILIEESVSIDCEHGFDFIAQHKGIKLRNVWDYKTVNGTLQATDCSNV